MKRKIILASMLMLVSAQNQKPFWEIINSIATYVSSCMSHYSEKKHYQAKLNNEPNNPRAAVLIQWGAALITSTIFIATAHTSLRALKSILYPLEPKDSDWEIFELSKKDRYIVKAECLIREVQQKLDKKISEIKKAINENEKIKPEDKEKEIENATQLTTKSANRIIWSLEQDLKNKKKRGLASHAIGVNSDTIASTSPESPTSSCSA